MKLLYILGPLHIKHYETFAHNIFYEKIVVFCKLSTFDNFTKKLTKAYKDLRSLLLLFWVRRIKILLHHKTKAK